MGNSLLDLMVFGKRSGTEAASRATAMPQGRLTLDHLTRFRAEAKKRGIAGSVTSPMLFPDYTRKEN
jgi:pyruvate dehydrogenase complex dehydrogenase (E1) component